MEPIWAGKKYYYKPVRAGYSGVEMILNMKPMEIETELLIE